MIISKKPEKGKAIVKIKKCKKVKNWPKNKKGCSTGKPPIHPNKMQLTKKNQKKTVCNGRKSELRISWKVQR